GAEMLAGDERCFGRAEKGDRSGDLGRMGQPPDASAAAHPAHLLKELGIGPPPSRKPGGCRALAPSASVSIPPGETHLTVMPWRTAWPANVAGKPTIEPFPSPANSVW